MVTAKRINRKLGLAIAVAVIAPATGASTALADHGPAPSSVVIAGSLQDELGCAADWQPACEATELEPTTAGSYRASFDLPAGHYEYKVALNGSWEENYGSDGAADGANIPLVLEGDATVTVTYDHSTHLVRVSPSPAPQDPTEADRELAGTSLRNDLTSERFYFVMADRFANGDATNDRGGYEVPDDTAEPRLIHGFDPADKGFYHGGDIAGITERLDYIEDLGTTAIWLTPSFKNRPVQGEGSNASAGYHGYWITDFTRIDPHLGTNEELRELIDEAHARGIKVFFDIITNHTADVIDYAGGEYGYVPRSNVPYRDASGEPFDDREFADGDEFPELAPETSFPYTPYFPDEADATVKVPAWLNDPTLYHNRGNAAFDGTEGDLYGDFVGLDDLFTEHPTVRDGMIDVYRYWATFGVDGFRIDTVKHVNMEFWQRFVPEVLDAAVGSGADDFFMFGEIFSSNPRDTSRYTNEGGLQASLDFGFQSSATGFARGRPPSELADFFASDDYYIDPDSNAYSLPTFLGNHDMGRIGRFIANSGAEGQELLKRDKLAHSLMYLTRGQPVVYYGDEQGFTGDGGDKDARQDMFESRVPSYNDDDLIGTAATTREANFDTGHPIYRHIAQLAELRDEHPALADGAQIPRYADDDAGVFAFSRIDAEHQREYLVALNNSAEPATAAFDTFTPRRTYHSVLPQKAGKLRSDADGRVTVTVPPLTAMVWKTNAPLKPAKRAPEPEFVSPQPGDTVGGRAEIAADVPTGGFNQVTFAWRPAGTAEWRPLGTDDNAPYRVFHDVTDLDLGTLVEYRVIVQDHSGNLAVQSAHGVAGEAPEPPDNTEPPNSVSVPGDLNTQMGCPDDWDPACADAMLTFDADGGVWTGTFVLPAGEYQFKAAINGSWAENYGADGVRDGPNIQLSVPTDGEVTFEYDHETHVITATLE